ncbi:two-component regulator propeller domain-containing protein [Fodinibius saliphilus]|uniref:two-component regulator propeller domain-containing protein n=1 Tax=Fodinibius saliphilus TaxID=1920650 RepID=UPI00110A06EC
MFSHYSEDSFSISSNEVRTLYEDDTGDIWVGTLARGFNLYDRGRDRFIQFKGEVNKRHQTLSVNIKE